MNTSGNDNNCIPYKSNILEKMYNDTIAPYGFKHKEKESNPETYRTELRRQRDKILYAGGFRRLQDKTQVISATLTGDHRTRLTHTLEVEQIATSVSDALGLNKDLVSAIALGHDVGHTPFGHAAERTLDKLLKKQGGFHHPIQSVKYLWEKYGDNLYNEIYEGILLHDSDMYNMEDTEIEKELKYCMFYDEENKEEKNVQLLSKYFNNVPSTLEAQVVVWADKIAYITHDLEDFLRSSIYSSAIKNKNQSENKLIDILNNMITYNGNECDKISDITQFELRNLLRRITSNLINSSANLIEEYTHKGVFKQMDIKEKTEERLDKEQDNIKRKFLNSLIINFDDDFREYYYELRKFLNDEYIFSPEVQRSDAKAQKIITSLFNEFKENYKLTPLNIRKKIDNEIRQQIKLSIEKISELEHGNLNQEELLSGNFNCDSEERVLRLNVNTFKEYLETKENIISRNIASYISTMSDTYAENMFCNLNASKDNYIL